MAKPVCDRMGTCPPSILKKKNNYRSIYSLRLSVFCKTLTLLSLHQCRSSLDLCVVAPSSFPFSSSSYGFSSLLSFFFFYWFTGQDQHFIFNCQPTQLPSLLFILLQPLDAPPHSFHFLHFLHFAFYFFDGMPFCFSVFIIDWMTTTLVSLHFFFPLW